MRKSIGPFNHRDSVVVEVIVQPDPLDLSLVVQSIKIEMENRQPALVFVNQREGGAGHLVIAVEASDEAFNELRLAGTKVAAQRHDIVRPERFRFCAGERDRFLRAV